MAADTGKPSLTAVGDAMQGLESTDAAARRACLARLERWCDDGLPDGAGALILECASRSFAPADAYPATPNEQLVQLLWNGRTSVAGEDVESVFPELDEGCRASAIRLLAELATRPASESLARVLSRCATGGLPRVAWPFLLPLERAPRDPDLLIPPLLDRVAETDGVGPVHATLLAFAGARMFTQEQSRRGAGIIARQASHAIGDLGRRLADHGLAGRWEDEYVSMKVEVGLLLDLLARLEPQSAVPVLERAVSSPDPWIKMWGALGMVRAESPVDPRVFLQIAASAECRIPLARQLDELARSELFPADFLNQPSLAEAAMVEWLLSPTELGRAPDEIEQLDVVPLETDDGVADLYVFAFRTRPPHFLADKGSIVGISGPFLSSHQPTFEGMGATFSRFETLACRSIEEHVQVLLETVDGMSGRGDLPDE